ncbi:MAG: glycosyltransferase family A protein [bacterium]|nr:glycosyltransferase family A protein [bacterium]
MNKPLVTICIPNYNYGHYLGHCLDSVLAQTYDNIEVIFSDNNSTDASYKIAFSYLAKFDEKGIHFRINRNKRNLGSDMNSQVCSRLAEGDYVYTLASDDAINPHFLERTISLLEEHRNVSCVMVNREEIDEQGNITKVVPFYNKSCVIPGESQAAVFMMAGIAIPAQRIVRRSISPKIRSYERVWNVAGDWYNNFLYACAGDIAYIKEDLVQYRVHSGNETSVSEDNLMGITEHYQLIHSFVELSKVFGFQKPIDRYTEAIEHLGDMCLRYAHKMLVNKKRNIAKKYLQLAPVYHPGIELTEKYLELQDISMTDNESDMIEKLEKYDRFHVDKRMISYDPPEGYVAL